MEFLNNISFIDINDKKDLLKYKMKKIYIKEHININFYLFNNYNYNNLIDFIIKWDKKLNLNKKKVIFHLFLTEKKKYFEKILTFSNVNNGLSYYFILIYRIEDIEKVLIHEMIHYYNLDYNELSLKKYPFKNRYLHINLNEAIVETLALILYIKDKQMNYYEFVKKSVLQINHILGYLDISMNELLNENYQFEKETNLFSYLILRTFFLLRPNHFMKTKNNINIFDFVTDKNILLFKKIKSDNRLISLSSFY